MCELGVTCAIETGQAMASPGCFRLLYQRW